MASSSTGHKSKKTSSKGKPQGDPEVHWGERCMVTPVIDQENLHICWVIVALGVCESKHLINNWNDKKNRDPTTTYTTFLLSKQELVNCFWEKFPLTIKEQATDVPENYDSEGFRIGKLRRALRYIETYGVSLEEDFPWTKKKTLCPNVKPNPRKVLWVKGIDFSPKASPWSQNEIEELLKEHPLAGGIGLWSSFMTHKSGEIYNGPNANEIDEKEIRKHAVLVIGFGTDSKSKVKYYIIRNSWGDEWGDKGYAKVKRHLISNWCYPKQVELKVEK